MKTIKNQPFMLVKYITFRPMDAMYGRWLDGVDGLGSSTDPSGGALWERFESEKRAQERNAGVEALGGKNAEEILGYTN